MREPFIIAGITFVVGVLVGHIQAHDNYEQAQAIAVAEQGARDYEKLRKSTDVLASVQSDLAGARAESERLRRLLARRATGASGQSDGARIAGCEKLLDEALEFLGECRERYLECAAKHDALVEASK